MDDGSRPTPWTWAELRLKQVTPRDRVLVEWVATSAVGDRIPEPWRWARSPTESVILTLVTLGVIPKPPPEADARGVARDAAGAAREWLEKHPVEEIGGPQAGPDPAA